MPMYSFVCRECEQNFERKLRMSQSGDTQECPTCGSKDTRKTIGSIAINGVSRSAGSSISAPPISSPFT
jgi:putative FmdB family regulatory protein